MKILFIFVALTFNVNPTFKNLFTAPFEVKTLSRALDVSTQREAVCFKNMQTNAICQKCNDAYIAPISHIQYKQFLCNKCTREKAKKWRLERKLSGKRVISTKMPKEYFKEYRKKKEIELGAPLSTIANKRHSQNELYRYKNKIRQISRKALKSGEIIKKPCHVCGNSKVEMHHIDYSKPLEIMWLCSKHHREWHKILNDFKYKIFNKIE